MLGAFWLISPLLSKVNEVFGRFWNMSLAHDMSGELTNEMSTLSGTVRGSITRCDLGSELVQPPLSAFVRGTQYQRRASAGPHYLRLVTPEYRDPPSVRLHGKFHP